MSDKRFPKIAEEQMRALLEPPSGAVRIVIDTDAKNEIDDQFTLAWALLSQDVLHIEGVYAAPYSFQYRVEEMRRAYAAQSAPDSASDEDRVLLSRYGEQIARLAAQGKTPDDISMVAPDVGMEESYQEILVVYDKMNANADGVVFRGSPGYLTSLDDPIRSPAAEHLVERAVAGSSDDPLYIVAIGAATNIASALLLAPEIIDRIVVTWTAGYPTTVKQPNYSFNLEQDMLASQLLFDSGVPHVYLPGFHIGAQLRLSLPEMETWVRGKGAIGDYLYWLYTHNPHYAFQGIDDHFGRTWIIWDLINIAWLLNPNWVPSDLVRAPRLGDDKRWHHDRPDAHLMREAYGIDRDAIFRDFFTKLEQAP